MELDMNTPKTNPDTESNEAIAALTARDAEHEAAIRIKLLTDIDNSGKFDDSDAFHEFYISELEAIKRKEGI